MSLAGRNLLQDRVRLALSVTGVGLAIMLILLLSGFTDGINRQATAYLDHAPGAVVVVQAGVTSLSGTTSLLPPDTATRVQATPGVGAAVPVLLEGIVLELRGRRETVSLIGYDPALGAGPWRLAAGREPGSDDEVVLDRVLARRAGLAVGDRLAVLGRTFTVAGLSAGTGSWVTSMVFARKTAVEAVLRVPGGTSLLFVTPAAGVAADVLRARLDTLDGVDALPQATLRDNDRQLLTRIFTPPVRLMAGVAFLIGTLVVGLVIYTATVERQREYGVLKALGARNGVLYRVVIVQSLVAAGAGSLLGVGLTLGAAQLIMTLRPQFLIVVEPRTVAQAVLTGLAMALVAALLPAGALARLAPADVFRR